MVNPIIDAITWNPSNKAKSIRDLQQALNDLQADWASKLPQLRQITRNGVVKSEDWDSVIAQNSLDTDRLDDYFYHYNNINREFVDEWHLIFGQYRQISANDAPGRSEKILLEPIAGRVSATSGTACRLYYQDVVITKPAKMFIFVPFLYYNTSVSDKYIQFYIDGVKEWEHYTRPTSPSIWCERSAFYLTEELSAGTYTVEFRAESSGGTVSVISPSPPSTLATIQNSDIEPSMAYVEVIYT